MSQDREPPEPPEPAEPPETAEPQTSESGLVHDRDGALNWGSILRNSLLVIVMLSMIWLAFNVRLPSIDDLREVIASLGWAGRLGFVALYAAVAMTPIPITVMAVTGGVLFGIVEGGVLSVIGVMLGCWGAYWLARALGHETVSKLLGSYADKVERQLRRAGFQTVFMLRLMPGLPYWPLNYGAGAFRVRHRDYLVASVIACVPGQVSLVSIGAFVSEPDVLGGTVVGVSWAVVIGMTIWAYRDLRGTSRTSLPGDPPDQ